MCPSCQECVCLQGNATIRASPELSCFRVMSKFMSSGPLTGLLRLQALQLHTYAWITTKRAAFLRINAPLIKRIFNLPNPHKRKKKKRATNRKTAASLVPVNTPLLASLHLCHPLCTSSCSSRPDVWTWRCRKILPSHPQRPPASFGLRVSDCQPPRCQAPCTWRRPDRQTAVTGHGQRRLAGMIWRAILLTHAGAFAFSWHRLLASSIFFCA